MDKLMKVDYPSHLIDPSEKDDKWVLQYIKAAYSSYETDNPREIFYHARYRYEVIKSYAMGNQSIAKYRPLMAVDDESKEDWLNIDWTVIPIVPKFRRIALGKLNKVDYNIVATPIDQLANDEITSYFNDIKAKIMVRDAARRIDPQLAEVQSLQPAPGEAANMEELEMQMNYTFKHEMAVEAEQGIEIIFDQNNVSRLREKIREDLFDYGVAGYREFIDNNGAVKIRVINPRNILINHCKNNDFSDAQHIGEIVEMTISDLKQAAGTQFSEEQYAEIAKSYIGQLGNPKEWPSNLSVYNKGYDKYRIRVVDLQFFSVNESVLEKRVDRRGNKIVAKASYDDRNKRKDKFKRVAYKVVYQGKWIVGTDYIFNAGLATDMKRAKSSLMDTSMDYHLIAPEFYDMKAYGMMEQLVPIADAIQIAWYRLQNAINQARPKGIMIEMGALEDIPLGQGGKKLTPLKVLDLYNKTGTLVYRKMDPQGRQTNYKPIEELENGLGRDVMTYWQIIQNNIQLIRDITGMNEMTDGSTPDPRTLTTVAQMAYESTNNAIAHIIGGERRLLLSMAKAVILRLQDVVKMGKFSGYVKSLGSNTMKFFQASPSLPLHEFGIILEDKPTDEQRNMLLQEMQMYKQSGLLEPDDSFLIQNTKNLKVAQQILAFKIKKRKQEEEEKAMRQQQMNAQVQQQSSMAAEQAKQQTIQIEGEIKAKLIEVEKGYEAKILQMKYGFELQLEQMRQGGKATVKQMETKGQKSVAKIKMGQPEDPEETPDPGSIWDKIPPVNQQVMPEEEVPEEEMYPEGSPEEEAQPEEMTEAPAEETQEQTGEEVM